MPEILMAALACFVTGLISYRVGHSRGYEDCQHFEIKHRSDPVLPPQLPYGIRKL